MKFFDILKKIPNTVTGFVITVAGVAVCKIPVAGAIAGPIIITAGLAQMGIGVKSKMDRSKAGLDPLSKEKAIANIFTQFKKKE
jgi:hypothetical protein